MSDYDSVRRVMQAAMQAQSGRAAEQDKPGESGPPDEGNKLVKALTGFLTALDALDRMIAGGTPHTADHDNLIALRRVMLDAFQAAGVIFISSLGQPFDPALHRAIRKVPDQQVRSGTIVEELTRGCLWQSKVLRYAEVVVADNGDSGVS